jgi:hypothetical protein
MNQRELVTAKAGERVAAADQCAHPCCRLDQDAIARCMTMPVVHALEAVEIDAEHCQAATTSAAVGTGERRSKPVAQHRAIPQPGERVRLGKMADTCLSRATLGHILADGAHYRCATSMLGAQLRPD